jgi:saccharopine dehydrogenase (NAD+, L-lysine-forming)
MLWLRSETKPGEKRVALTPGSAAALVRAGLRVTVERSAERVFPDAEYAAAGCVLAGAGEWVQAPRTALILGLKELPVDDRTLRGRHCYFAHLYKGQAGASRTLARFRAGRGRLYDLEYLTDAEGRRVAAFGYWAGYVGAALGVQAWAARSRGGRLAGPLRAWDSRAELVRATRAGVAGLATPRVIVTGALGRSGRGATDLLREVFGAEVRLSLWDQTETRAGGPFAEIADHDLLVHCVGSSAALAPFVTEATLAAGRLAVIADVTADFGNPTHLLPVVDGLTTLVAPVSARSLGGRELHSVAIDHLPTLLPRESSEDFSAQLAPHLEQYLRLGGSGPWLSALAKFEEYLA